MVECVLDLHGGCDMIRLLALLILLPSLAMAQSVETPNDTSAVANTPCTTDPSTGAHSIIDDDPDSPGGDWCVSDSNNVNPSWTVNMTDPSITLDDTTDAQVIAVYVREFQVDQGGDPDIRVDIYDGTDCADLHETGADQTITDNHAGTLLTESWTSAGISAAADVCVSVVCSKSGGSPGNRQSCDVDAVEWRAAEAAGGGARRRVWVIQ
jgi:hypothetical protein